MVTFTTDDGTRYCHARSGSETCERVATHVTYGGGYFQHFTCALHVPGQPWAAMLEALPTISQGHTANLKVTSWPVGRETGPDYLKPGTGLRVWLSRMGTEDGEPFESTVYVESFDVESQRWTEIGHYDGDIRDPKPWPDRAWQAHNLTVQRLANYLDNDDAYALTSEAAGQDEIR